MSVASGGQLQKALQEDREARCPRDEESGDGASRFTTAPRRHDGGEGERRPGGERPRASTLEPRQRPGNEEATSFHGNTRPGSRLLGEGRRGLGAAEHAGGRGEGECPRSDAARIDRSGRGADATVEPAPPAGEGQGFWFVGDAEQQFEGSEGEVAAAGRRAEERPDPSKNAAPGASWCFGGVEEEHLERRR